MSDDKSFVPVVLDREISSPNEDAFGHRHFAQLIQGLIESSRNEPPYSIGLLGRWGTGKSSIKSLYLSSLIDEAASSQHKLPRSRRIHPITFNAWRFGGEDIKRALLRQVYLEIGGDKGKLDDALFKHVQTSKPEQKDGWKRLKDTFKESSFNLIVALAVFLVVIGLVVFVGRTLELTGTTVVGVLATVATGSATVLVKFLIESSQSPKSTTITKVEAPSSTVEQYEDFLILQLHTFKNNQKSYERIVIFVDDLDRLSPEEMIGGLDAVRTFMEIPKKLLPDGLGIVFVISCDEDRIADALADKRRRTADLPGAVFTHADAHRFLDRIFQFRLEIPPFPKRDMRNFSESALVKALPDLKNDLTKVHASLETLIDHMIHVGIGTPRNALQVINAFVQAWWIAKRRERDGAGTESPGGLQEGAVTQHPLALGAICALRVDFPDFYRDLQQEPDLIGRFTDVFIRKVPLKDCPDSVQHALHRYSVDGETPHRVRPEHRMLRQYISSLQGIRWPRAMRPLLFLSQDPVSRKYGDNALALFESFVSGDEAGVLAQLGREHDSQLFSDADMRLLHDLVEELERESDVRRNNAAAVLAAFGDRYPAETAHLLLSPLARRLSEADELRWRVGVSKIGRILGPVSPTDRREVAACLVRDLLKTDGQIQFRLETGEPPSLDEAMTMAHEACSLALQVRRDDGLNDPTNDMLMRWLESRRVAVADREQFLPFTAFEKWMSIHESWLLPALSGRYSDRVLEHVRQDGGDDGLIVEEVVRHCQTVFELLHHSGEDSRDELWRQLTGFVAVETPAFVNSASDFVREHVESPDESAISIFLAAFANRLSQESDEPTEGFDLTLRSTVLIEIATKRCRDLNESCSKELTALINQWSHDGDLAENATRLLSPICRSFEESANEIVSDWTTRFYSNLPNACIKWLAQHFSDVLSEQQRRQIIKRINPIHQTDNVSVEQSQQYNVFMREATDDALATLELKAHLDNTINQIRQRHANPNDYLRRVFPSVTQVLGKATPEQVGPMLNELFSNTKGDPVLFGWLHQEIADHWPDPTVSKFNPEAIFSDALEVATKKPLKEGRSGVLRTMTNLVRRGVVSIERSKQVADAACQIWRLHQQQSSETLTQLDVAPSTHCVASIVDGLNSADSEVLLALTNVWRLLAARMALDERITTAEQLLSKAAVGTDDDPDICFRLWIDSKSEDRRQMLERLMESDAINDEQRRRVWLQCERNGEIGHLFGHVLPKIASRNDSPLTISRMLDAESRIISAASTQDARYVLGQQIVQAFRSSSSSESKNRMASLLKRLEVEGVLKELTKYGDLSEDETAILDSHFSKSKHWKKIKT
jgi:hypothetical protein